MNKQYLCNLILKRMREFGYKDFAESCDGWTDEEMDYFIENYDCYLQSCSHCGAKFDDPPGCLECSGIELSDYR